jgi:hypothetical protein
MERETNPSYVPNPPDAHPGRVNGRLFQKRT